MRLALALVLMAGAARAEVELRAPAVLSAEFVQPTTRYDHGILGDAIEWGGLQILVVPCAQILGCFDEGTVSNEVLRITLPASRVFEDLETRLADLDNDGAPEVIVVETDIALGASLAVYGPEGKIAATPYIGQTHRWLAPAGIADFDGDGRVEIAYVDRPHLLASLVFVRLEGDRLVEIARVADVTNHRIGDDFISGGVRDCGAGQELVLASKDWARMLRVRWAKAGPVAADIGAWPGGGLQRLPGC
ncbi:VCBS repeat-containing protein [Tabrizicola sp.]|uniref:FG-GAP repeat domain-containing protein n=1 Tax=Tabrizicola sp. TaxID=2005166 RepID=UPI00286D5F17|nr:VCBS repeat-containing protein [Tabrizicola sp.]